MNRRSSFLGAGAMVVFVACVVLLESRVDRPVTEIASPPAEGPGKLATAGAAIRNVQNHEEHQERMRSERSLPETLGLQPARQTHATRLFGTHSVEELGLLARIQQHPNSDALAEVERILQAHRQGASPEQLRQAADRILEDNPLSRHQVLQWLEQQEGRGAPLLIPPEPGPSMQGTIRSRPR